MAQNAEILKLAEWGSSESGFSVMPGGNSYVAMTVKSNAKIGVKEDVWG